MKESRIAKTLYLNSADMKRFKKFALRQSDIPVDTDPGGSIVVDDSDVDALYQAWLEERNPAAAQKRARARERAKDQMEQGEELDEQFSEDAIRREEERKRLRELAAAMPITSTPSFEGFRIVEYGGYVAGDEIVMLSDSILSSGGFDQDFIDGRVKGIRNKAIEKMKISAAQIGCNAVVGLDFDYVTINRQRPSVIPNTLVNETFVILTANGTAVKIEPA